MNPDDYKWVVEAVLMSSRQPLSVEQILSAFEDWERPDRTQLRQILLELQQDYAERAIELMELASGYCFQTKHRYAPWIARLLAEKPSKYSNALLETLSIIAYKQPVTRADIEDIRGVAVSSAILKTLMEREWVRIAGHRDVPGKPAVYVTTKAFLDYFNIATLDALPLLDTTEHE